MSGQINRAAQLWQNWEQKQQMLKEVFGGDAVAADLSRQKHDFLTQGMHQITRPSADEKMVLELIGKATGKLEKQLYPNPLIRLLHKVKELVYDQPLRAAKMERQKLGDVFRLETALEKLGIAGSKLDLASALDYQRQSIELNIAAPYGTARILSSACTWKRMPWAAMS